jgi:ribokinase
MMNALTVGGAMIDTIAIIESSRIELMKMRNADTSFLLLEEGRKTEADEISTHCGGGAVNAAVAMARLGWNVSTIVKLGRDARADVILSRLTGEGISTRWVAHDDLAPTGASVLLSSHDRNAAVFTFRGANGLIGTSNLPLEAFAVDLVHISSLSNASADQFPLLVSRAKECGALVSANPGVRQLSARGGDFLQSLAKIDILSLNRSEADSLVPGLAMSSGGSASGPVLGAQGGEALPVLAIRGLTSGGHHLGLRAFMRAIGERGPGFVVLTDGGGGAYVGTREEIVFCPSIPTKVSGTAGAGDAFAATFATYIRRGVEPDIAVRAAAINAAAVLGHVDTQSGLLYRDALDAKLADSGQDPALRRWAL